MHGDPGQIRLVNGHIAGIPDIIVFENACIYQFQDLGFQLIFKMISIIIITVVERSPKLIKGILDLIQIIFIKERLVLRCLPEPEGQFSACIDHIGLLSYINGRFVPDKIVYKTGASRRNDFFVPDDQCRILSVKFTGSIACVHFIEAAAPVKEKIKKIRNKI